MDGEIPRIKATEKREKGRGMLKIALNLIWNVQMNVSSSGSRKTVKQEPRKYGIIRINAVSRHQKKTMPDDQGWTGRNRAFVFYFTL